MGWFNFEEVFIRMPDAGAVDIQGFFIFCERFNFGMPDADS